MKDLKLISLHVKNGERTGYYPKKMKPIPPAHKLYCIAKYIFKKCKYKYERDYKPVKYEMMYRSYDNSYALSVGTYNKKTGEKDYCTMGLYITNDKDRSYYSEPSESGLYINIVSHSRARISIPFTYDMFHLFKELKYINNDKRCRSWEAVNWKKEAEDDDTPLPEKFFINSYKRIRDLSIEELEEMLHIKKLAEIKHLKEKHRKEVQDLKTYLNNNTTEV